jgi:RimJ/RimL family protein N-acetyltransferase
MTDAVGTIMWQWGIPRMGVRQILVTATAGNNGSVRVFEKNGFMLTKTVENYVEYRGRMHDLHILRWSMNAAQSSPSPSSS